MASTIPTVRLNTGAEMPMLGLGTFAGTRKTRVTPVGVVGKSVEDAIEKHGYRLLDCAQNYLNEDEIGDAVNRVWLAVLLYELAKCFRGFPKSSHVCVQHLAH
jgi:diketogulonate reductase-like aldo/keto reductase